MPDVITHNGKTYVLSESRNAYVPLIEDAAPPPSAPAEAPKGFAHAPLPAPEPEPEPEPSVNIANAIRKLLLDVMAIDRDECQTRIAEFAGCTELQVYQAAGQLQIKGYLAMVPPRSRGPQKWLATKQLFDEAAAIKKVEATGRKRRRPSAPRPECAERIHIKSDVLTLIADGQRYSIFEVRDALALDPRRAGYQSANIGQIKHIKGVIYDPADNTIRLEPNNT